MFEIADRSSSATPPGGQKIPARIFQTFEFRSVPSAMYEATRSWVRLNEEYDYVFFDRDDRREFIREHFESDVLEAYDRVGFGAQKADIWRYCVLHFLGGVYGDVDFVCVTPLRQILRDSDEFVAAKAHAPPRALVNGFIASVPGHPFLEAALERSVENVLSGAPLEPMGLTGPVCFGEAANSTLERAFNTPFQSGAQEVNGVSFRLVTKHQSQDRSPHRIVDDSKTLFICKYDGYEADLASVGLEHWQSTLSRAKRVRPSHWLNAARRRLHRLGRLF